MKELKPCPFCGYEIKDFVLRYVDGHLDELTATCWICRTKFDLFNDYDEFPPDAIDRWNRRVTNDPGDKYTWE